MPSVYRDFAPRLFTALEVVYVPTQPISKTGYIRSALHTLTVLMTLQRRLLAHGNFDLPAMEISARSSALGVGYVPTQPIGEALLPDSVGAKQQG